MRTTLTVDDEVMKQLRELARTTDRPLREVVNEVLRQGLSVGAAPARRGGRFRVRPRACGFRGGVDLRRLNQLVDELEIDRAAGLVIRDR